MASTDGKSLDGDDNLDSPTNDSMPSMTMHPLNYSGMPMHMYPFPPGLVPTQPLRSKRRQVKNACTNCQKACKKCDDARPCLRCVKYGIAEECIDSQRKERKKGIKRGPYKKRDGKGSSVEQIDVPEQPIPTGVPPSAGPNPTGSYVGPVGYPPGFFSQYPHPPGPKPGDGPTYYPQIYFTPVAPPPTHGSQDGDGQGYHTPHPQYYPATFLTPYAQPYAPYVMHSRPDGQMALPGPHYTAYGTPMFHKTLPTSTSGSNVHGMDGVRGVDLDSSDN